jgi:trk system potassium uptake protein TrkA
MYIIIVGCGKFGSNLARGLSDDGYNVCIIDRNADRLDSLGSGFNGQRIKGIEYDSDNLLEAGIKHADAVIAATPDDNVNITVSLIADKIFAVPQIIARVNDPEKNLIYHKMGIYTINPIQYELEIVKNKLAVRCMNIILKLDMNYEIIELQVEKEKTSSVADLENRYHCIISGLIKDDLVRIPEKGEQLQNGDRIFCTVHKSDKKKLIHYLCKKSLI